MLQSFMEPRPGSPRPSPLRALAGRLKPHAPLLAGASGVLLVFLLPYVRLAAHGIPIWPFFQEAEAEYALVLDHFAREPRAPGDPWLPEHRPGDFPYPDAPFRLAATAVSLLGTCGFQIFADLALPVLAFLAAFWLGREWALGHWAAVVFSLTYVLLYGSLPEFVSRVSAEGFWVAVVKMGALRTGYATAALEISRAPFGAIAAPAFLAACAAALRAAREDDRRGWVVVGLLLLLLVYIRTLLAAFLGVFLVWEAALLLRRRKRKEALAIAAVLGLLACAALPMVASVRIWERDYPEQALRSGIVRGRALQGGHIYPGAWALVLLLPAVTLAARGHPELRRFGPGVLVAYAVTAHSNLLTGKFGFVHHLQHGAAGPFVLPLIVASLGACVPRLREPHWAVPLAAGVLLLYAAPRFYYATSQIATFPEADFAELRRLRDSGAVTPGASVAAPPGFFELFNGNTNLIPGCGPFSRASDAEIVDRLLIYWKLMGLPDQAVAGLLEHPTRDPVAAQALHVDGWTRRKNPAAEAAWITRYADLPDDPDALIEFARTRYRLDVVVIAPQAAWIGGSERFLAGARRVRLHYASARYKVFEILPP